MQNRIIKVGCITSIITAVIVILIQLINNQLLDYKMVFISFIWSLVVGTIAIILYKVAIRNLDRNLKDISVELEENETIIVERPASCCHQKKTISGKLILTSGRLIFKTKIQTQENFYLQNIKNIKIKKTRGIFHDGIIVTGNSTLITGNGSVQKYVVDYPKDWKALIECQKDLNENGNITENNL